MKKVFGALLLLASLSAHAELPPGKSFSFKGASAIDLVRSGRLTRSVRVNDRSQAPYSYKVGTVLPIINADTNEERRTEEEQVAAEAYKFIEVTAFTVTAVASLNAADLAELRAFYSQEKIDKANGIITIVNFKYRTAR